MSENIDHGFWEIKSDNPKPIQKKLYPPHIVRNATPQQRRENIEWAEGVGGYQFDPSFNPTYVIFQDCIYNVYNGDIYKPTYFQNEWTIRLFKMQRGIRKDNKEEMLQSFNWNHLQQVYNPKAKFPKP